MTTPLELKPLLDYIRRYVDWPDEEVELLEKFYWVETLASKEIWLAQGESIDNIAFIAQGVLRVFRMDEKKEITLFLKKENDFTGSLTDYAHRRLSPYAIQALEETKLLVITKESQKHLLEESASYREFILKVLEETATQFQGRVDSLLSLRGQERYLHFLQQQTGLINRVTQYHVASYLGLTAESLSRLRRMKD